MSSSEERFNEAAAQVVRTYARRDEDRLAYERAWATFYRDHLEQVVREGNVYASARGLGYEVDDLRIELAIRVLDVLAKGRDLNKRVVYGIRGNVLGTLSKQVKRLGDPDVVERCVERMRDAADTGNVDTQGMRARLEDVLHELEQRPRQELRVQVLRTMLDTGESTLAEVGRLIDRDEGSVRSAFFYVTKHIREHHGDLADFLELPEPMSDAESVGVTGERRA